MDSRTAFERACKVLVGGVDSPVRAFAAVGGTPPVIASAKGAYLTDVAGRRYIDYVGSYGPAILGHAHPAVVEAIQRAAERGTSFGAPTETETLLAETILTALPSAQKVRFVSSGTEAVMTAVRLARGATGRNKVLKFAGCYHGHADAMLVAAGSGATTLDTPSSPGVPPGATADTLTANYNDVASVDKVFDANSRDLAAVLVEPVAGNMGVVPPASGFLEHLRSRCTECGALLVFDEVMTGFRLAWGGAQSLFNIQPDLTTLGKVIGGGLPVGAVAGPDEIMKHLSPVGPVYQAGTLSGNPLAMSAGLATLKVIRDDKQFYARLERASNELEAGLRRQADRAGMSQRVCFRRVGSMLCCFFRTGAVENYGDARASNARAFAAFFHAMLDAGVYLAPSQFEAWFVSSAHGGEEIARTIESAGQAFAAATN